MNKIVAPEHFEADKPDDKNWTYGTRVEQPMEGSDPLRGQDLSDDQSGSGAREGPRRDTGAAASGSSQRDDKADATRPGNEVAPPESRKTRRADQDRASAAPDTDRTPEAKSKRDGPAEAEPKQSEDEPPRMPSKLVFVIVALVLLCLLAWGAYKHWSRDSDASATQQTTQNLVPEVRTTVAQRQDKPVDLTLPGQTEALFTANIYPRATGYVGVRNVDIGSRVKEGDLLIHISSPDLDQQLAQAEAQVGQVKAAEEQARAQVVQAQANLALAKVTLARTSTLTQQGYETLQNRDNQTANQEAQQASVDTAKAGVKVAEANTKAQMATVDRLKALAGFEDVKAPFDGVVTTRNVDIGDLVNADSATAAPMFSVARDDIIRVTVQVPQNAAVGVKDGLASRIEVPQLPGQIFTGSVTRSSVALLSSARTLATEVDIPNPDRRLRPGLFVYATIGIPRQHPAVILPAETLIFNQHGLQVAVVDGDHVKLHDVKIDRDFGTTVEIGQGLDGGEQVVLSPPAILPDGATVSAKAAEDKRPEGGDQPDQKKTGDAAKKPDGG